MQRRKVAHQIAEDLFAAEAAVDDAIAKMATLAGRLVEGRLEARLSAVVGQPVFEKIGRAVAMQTEVRGVIVEVHHALSDVKDQVGLRTVAFGVLDKPEESQARLTVVDADKAA